MTMNYRLFGRTGVYVSELCLGTMTFGGADFFKVMGSLQQKAVRDQVEMAFDAGVNFIDTADVYSLGAAEKLTGQAIKDLVIPRDQLFIATKGGLIMDDSPNGRGLSRYHLLGTLHQSLERMQIEYVDLYQLHCVDPLTPIEETLGVLNDMVRSGLVRYIGLSNMAAWQIMKSLAITDRRSWARFESAQIFYTLAARDAERELLPLAEDQDLAVTVWSPLAGGLLTGKFSADSAGPEEARRTSYDFPIVDKERAFRCVDVMKGIANEHGCTVAQVALAWLLSRRQVTSVIIGARTKEQLQANLAATKIKLSDKDIAALDEVSRLPPEYPGWMFEFQGRYRRTPPSRP